MWSAKIAQKGIQDKSFLVNIAYTNGTVAFNEILDMTGGTIDSLSTKVQSRLDTLNTTDTLMTQVTTGPFTPSTQTPSASDKLITALKHYNSCKRAVDLGLIAANSQTVTDAQTALTTAFDISLVDLV